MRIIAGECKGRRLQAPRGRRTRPILDDLKERMFNILGPSVAGATAWDLFAGSGSIGLEALSRGAERVVFVERDRRALTALRENVEALGFGPAARVVAGDAFVPRWAGESRPTLVFLDPPFPVVEAEPERLRRLLENEIAPRIPGDGAVVLRVPAQSSWESGVAGFAVETERSRGESRMVFYRRAD